MTTLTAPAPGAPAEGADVIVQVENLHKAYGDLKVLKGVSLTIYKGEVVVLIGPSGSGKTSFLRCLNRLIDPEQGRILVAGYDLTSPKTNLPKARRHIGLVSQHFNLYPHKTAVQNVMEGPVVVLKQSKAAARQKAEELLTRVGLADKFTSYPRQLSGGQQQRVAIARALAMDPALMLFDEPTSALDPELTGEVLDVMKELADSGMTMIVVSHEMHFASRVADRVIVFDEGVIVEEGSAEQVFTQARNERTRRFLNQLLSWETDQGELLATRHEGGTDDQSHVVGPIHGAPTPPNLGLTPEEQAAEAVLQEAAMGENISAELVRQEFGDSAAADDEARRQGGS